MKFLDFCIGNCVIEVASEEELNCFRLLLDNIFSLPYCTFIRNRNLEELKCLEILNRRYPITANEKICFSYDRYKGLSCGWQNEYEKLIGDYYDEIVPFIEIKKEFIVLNLKLEKAAFCL